MSHHSIHRTSPSKPKRYVRDYPLEELFDDDDLLPKLRVAEYRICQAFFHAKQWSNGKMRGTDNFIVGVGPRQKHLVEYIFERVLVDMGSRIVTASELPKFERETATSLRFVAHNAERRLLAVQLSMMARDQKLWFNEEPPGTWNIVPSIMDSYRLDRERAAEAYYIDQQIRREGLHGGGRLMKVPARV